MMLQPPDDGLVSRVEEFLVARYDMRRRPEVAARTLAFIIKLHEARLPFPQRRAVAEALGCSKFSIDSAVSTYLARGLLKQSVETVDGNIARPVDCVVRERYYTPSRELLALA
jgi:hypothetical protein